MQVWWAALAGLGICLQAVPLHLAVVLRDGRLGAGLAPFEARFARKAALDRLGKPRKKPPGRLPAGSLGSGRRALRYLLPRTRASLRIRIGLGDAAATAMACGTVSTLIRAFRSAAVPGLEAKIAPDFAANAFSAELWGIITLRIGHIILAALIGIIDFGNGRLSAWINTRLKTS